MDLFKQKRIMGTCKKKQWLLKQKKVMKVRFQLIK